MQKRQTKSGATIYVVKWRTPDGADRTKGGFSTRKAANAYATKVEAGKLRGVEFDPKAGGHYLPRSGSGMAREQARPNANDARWLSQSAGPV